MTTEEQYYYDLERQRIPYQRRLSEEEERQKESKKERMGWGIFIIALLLSLIADAAEFFTAGTLGWFVGLIVDLILLLMLGLSNSGRKQFKRWVWGPIIEKIPILATIPFIRVVFLVWAFASSRSKTLKNISNLSTTQKSVYKK